MPSLLPIDESRDDSSFSNAAIDVANSEIKEAASELGLTYLDLHDAFVGAGGGIRPELSYDGVHLRPEGYLLWRDLLKRYVPAGR